MTATDDISLLITAGDGPEECEIAVRHVMTRMQDEAAKLGLDCSIHATGSRSAVVVVHGAGASGFAKAWLGTVLWRMKSPVRKTHKRSNWFVGVFALDRPAETGTALQMQEIRFSTCRAGGPGGQHQNTTDSAVRAVHVPTGLTTIARDGRSQHRNKALAMARLQALFDAQATAQADQQKSARNQLHRQLERGNPVRRFKGAAFSEF